MVVNMGNSTEVKIWANQKSNNLVGKNKKGEEEEEEEKAT